MFYKELDSLLDEYGKTNDEKSSFEVAHLPVAFLPVACVDPKSG